MVRQFEFDFFKPSVSMTKDIKLFVKEKGGANSYAFWSSLSVCGECQVAFQMGKDSLFG